MSRSCFIVGPIGSAGTSTRKVADWLLHGLIKPVLEAEGMDYSVKRADEDASPGSINHAVMTDVINSDLVIADLTGFNPNAFYELGIRHAVQKPAIHIIAEAVDLPFDNKDQRTIFIDLSDYESVQRGKVRLKDAVEATHADDYRVINPYTQAGALNVLRGSDDPKDQIIAGLEERLSRLEDRQSLALRDGPTSSSTYTFNRDLLTALRSWEESPKAKSTFYDSLSPRTIVQLVAEIIEKPGEELTEAQIDLLARARSQGLLTSAMAARVAEVLEEYYINNVNPRSR